MNSKRILITLTAVLALAAGTAFAQPPAGDPGPGFGGPGHGHHRPHGLLNPDRLAWVLDLTPEQSEQLAVLAEEHRARVEPLHEMLRTLREDLHELRHAPDPDATALGELVLEMTAVGDQVRASFEELDARFSALLDPEQLERWEELKERRRDRRENRRDRRGQFGPRVGGAG